MKGRSLVLATACLLAVPAVAEAIPAVGRVSIDGHTVAYQGLVGGEKMLVTQDGYARVTFTDFGGGIILAPGAICSGNGTSTVTCRSSSNPGGDFFGVNMAGGLGNDTITIGQVSSGYLSGATLSGDDGADRLRIFGEPAIMHGGTGADTLTGDGGSDSLEGGDGADAVYGGAGDDDIRGGNGADRLFGQDGNDTMRHGDALIQAADSIDCGLGSDLAFIGPLDLTAGCEVVVGG